MKMIIAVISIFTISCGPKYPKNGYETNEAFKPFVSSFEQNMSVKNRVPVVFKNLEGSNIGLCHRYANNVSANWIEIDEDYWSYLDDMGKEELIYHELGHCVFGLDHDDSEININGNTIEKTIMNSYHFGYRWYYQTYRDYYIDELRSRAY